MSGHSTYVAKSGFAKWMERRLPIIGHLPLASALVFDTGVYMVVFAGALLMLSTMGTVKHRQRAMEENR